MNWLQKSASLEPQWWHRFYEHLTKTALFIFPETGYSPVADFTPRLQSGNFSSGIDGGHVFFSLYVSCRGNIYRGGITLEFADTLIRSKMEWQHANLLSIDTSAVLIKSQWSAIRDFHDAENVELVGTGIFLPQDSTPHRLLTAIKNAILKDGEDEDDFEVNPELSPPSVKTPAPFQPQF